MTHYNNKISLPINKQDLWELLVKSKVYMREKDIIGEVVDLKLTTEGIEIIGSIELSIEEDKEVEEYLKLRRLLTSIKDKENNCQVNYQPHTKIIKLN
jgi:hypothetical protein